MKLVTFCLSDEQKEDFSSGNRRLIKSIKECVEFSWMYATCYVCTLMMGDAVT